MITSKRCYLELLAEEDFDVVFLDELYGQIGDAEIDIVEGAQQAGGGGRQGQPHGVPAVRCRQRRSCAHDRSIAKSEL